MRERGRRRKEWRGKMLTRRVIGNGGLSEFGSALNQEIFSLLCSSRVRSKYGVPCGGTL